MKPSIFCLLIVSSLTGLGLNPSTQAATSEADGCTIAGDGTSLITIEEFADFECPYCERGSKVLNEVLSRYGGKIRLVFRNLPLSKLHPHALNAAKAFSAVCLQDPALASSFQKELFNHQNDLQERGDNFLYETAQKIGADVEKMKNQMNSPRVAQILLHDKKAAEVNGISGTPSFLVGTEPLMGAYPYDEFKRLIDRQIKH